MKKMTLCSVVNLLLVAAVWVGLVVFAHQVLRWHAVWEFAIVAVVALPIAGYFVQYLLSPIVNRLTGGKVPRWKKSGSQ
jgi:hypothetical protein